MKILIVEDENEIREVVKAYLAEGGYQVITADDGLEALELFDNSTFDLIILDLMLPKIDGWKLAARIRETSQIPIIMLTARKTEADRIKGLNLGADDYVVKPFSPRELVARVEAVLRRSSQNDEIPKIIVGDLEIDLARCAVHLKQRTMNLTSMEFNLLATLARHPERVFTRLQLIESLQGAPYEIFERTIDSHIKNLRKKIELDPQDPLYIQTVYGMGYRLMNPRAATEGSS